MTAHCEETARCSFTQIASGGVNAAEETRLMVSENFDATLEAGSILMSGQRSGDIIDFYRMHVAANVARLS
jgi:hypothetical protein